MKNLFLILVSLFLQLEVYSQSLPDLFHFMTQSPSSGVAGQNITLQTTVRNGTSIPSSSSVLKYYLSSNSTWDQSDLLLDSDAVPAMGGYPAGSTQSTSVQLPLNITGYNYIILYIDADHQISESNENNNTYISQIYINDPTPDLFNFHTNCPTFAVTNSTISVSTVVRNGSPGASESSTLKIYFSNDNSFGPGDVLLATKNVPAIGPSPDGSTQYANINLPQGINGNRYILFIVDANNEVTESNENNNIIAKPINIQDPIPDFIVTNLNTPSTAKQGTQVSISFKVKNQGTGSGNAGYSKVYLSGNTSISGAHQLDSDYIGTLGAGSSSSTITATGNIPIDYPTGSKYIIVVADANSSTPESNEGNNKSHSTITIEEAKPDFVPTGTFQVSPTTNVIIGTESIDWSFYVKNQGEKGSDAGYAEAFLSTDQSLSTSDHSLGYVQVGTVGADQSKQASNFGGTYGLNSGNYYVLFVVDTEDDVDELDENNNTHVHSVQVQLVSSGGRSIVNHQSNDLLDNNKVLKIYPNPCSDYLVVEFSEQNKRAITSVSLFGIDGRKALSHENLTTNKETIDLRNLKKGIYIIETIIDGKTYKDKLVIN